VSCDPGCTHWRIVINAWETWTVAAADGVCCARVRWEIIFLLTFETAPFFCVYPVYTMPILCILLWLSYKYMQSKCSITYNNSLWFINNKSISEQRVIKVWVRSSLFLGIICFLLLFFFLSYLSLSLFFFFFFCNYAWRCTVLVSCNRNESTVIMC
jgi:hypothetical protein